MSVLRSSFVVSSLTMLSRVFGFARDMVIAARLGASSGSDAFFVALMLPNLFRRLFAEGAFNVVFVPILSRIEEQRGRTAAAQFASRAYTLLAIVLTIITIIAEIFMGEIIRYVISPGWDDPAKLAFATQLGRITFPYLMLITFASLAGGILGTYGRFAPFALVPILFNIALIIGLLVLPYTGLDPATAGAISVTVGGLLQMGYMWLALRKINIRLKLQPVSKKLVDRDMNALIKRFGPAALSVGILQLSFLIDMHLASYLEDNAISYLQFANRFYQQPLAMIGIALATVLLPHLSRTFKAGDKTHASTVYSQALIYGLALALASTAGLYLLAFPIINTLFGHGKFTPADALMVAEAMQMYCLALPAFVITKVTLTCFYASEDAKTPLIVSTVSLILNVIFNLILMQHFGYVGIAMATALAGWCNAALQLWLLSRKQVVSLSDVPDAWRLGAKMVIITGILWGVLYGFVTLFPVTNSGTALTLLWLVGVVLLGVMVFLMLSHALKFFDVAGTLKSVLKKTG